MEFLNWETLATAGGALVLTSVFVQALKSVFAMSPRRVLGSAVVIGVVIVVAANIALGHHTPAALGLALLNGIVVALAATGLYEQAKDHTP